MRVTTFYPVSDETLSELPPAIQSELLLDAALFLQRVAAYILKTRGAHIYLPLCERNPEKESLAIVDRLASRCMEHSDQRQLFAETLRTITF